MSLRLPDPSLVEIPPDLLSLARDLHQRDGRPTAAYARISLDNEKSALGVVRQLHAQLTELFDEGYQLIGVYADNSKSAFGTAVRADYDELLTAMRSGAVSVVTAYRCDRLERQFERSASPDGFVQTGRRAGIAVRTARQGVFDLANPDDVDRFYVEVLQGQRESRRLSVRLTDKHAELAREGKPHGGRRPFGWEADGLTPRQPEFDMIAEAARRILAGESQNAICTDWHGRGVTTSGGERWSGKRLSRMLRRPRNAGIREHQGREVGKAAWVGPLDEVTFRALVQKLTSTGHAPVTPRRSGVLVGSGTFRCGKCGSPMDSGGLQRKDGAPRYRCRAEGCHITRAAGPVDGHVLGRIAALLDATYVVPTPPFEENVRLLAERDALEERKRTVAAMFGRGDLDEDDLYRATVEIRQRLSTVRAAIDALVTEFFDRPADVGSAAEFLGWPIERQRKLIKERFRVTLQPQPQGRKGFREDSVTVERRQP